MAQGKTYPPDCEISTGQPSSGKNGAPTLVHAPSGAKVQGNNPNGRRYFGSGGAGVGSAAHKMNDLNTPGPVNVFVVLDEQADSMSAVNGDATFMVDPGYPPAGEFWRDLPGSYHNGAGSFSFADGHSEIHKWLQQGINARTVYPVAKVTYGNSAPWKTVSMRNASDYEWVQDHMPYQQ